MKSFAKKVEVIHIDGKTLLNPEPSGIFELGAESVSATNLKENNGFYIVKWPLGKFYLSCNAGFEDMEMLLKDYIKKGRKQEEVFAKSKNPSRPSGAFPDDGHWVEKYLKLRGIDCEIMTPKIRFESGYSPSLG